MNKLSPGTSFNIGVVAILVGICGIALSLLIFIGWTFSEAVHFQPLAWSPDGTKLAFGALYDEWDTSLWIIDSDGQNPKKLTRGCEDNRPCQYATIEWSKDGNTIYYNAYNSPEDRWFAISARGGEPRSASPADVSLRESPKEALSVGGLLAQSLCTVAYYSTPSNWALSDECFHELQVTNSQTGKLVFTFDASRYMWTTSGFPIVGSVVAGIISSLAVVIGVLLVVSGIRRTELYLH